MWKRLLLFNKTNMPNGRVCFSSCGVVFSVFLFFNCCVDCAVFKFDCPVGDNVTECKLIGANGGYVDRAVNVSYYNVTTKKFCGQFGCRIEQWPRELRFTGVVFEEVSVVCGGHRILGCVFPLPISSYVCEPCAFDRVVETFEENLGFVMLEHLIIGLLCWAVIMLLLLLFMQKCNKYCPAPESYPG
uniref:Uncharacterized protein n=1 Tax=Bird gammacoronavirus AnasCN24 TaxID=3237959 RepID=A0AB39AEV3_9GAMC